MEVYLPHSQEVSVNKSVEFLATWHLRCTCSISSGGMCHWTLFSWFFFSPFWPNFFTFLTTTPFFLIVRVCATRWINPGSFLSNTVLVTPGTHQHSPGSHRNRRALDPKVYHWDSSAETGFLLKYCEHSSRKIGREIQTLLCQFSPKFRKHTVGERSRVWLSNQQEQPQGCCRGDRQWWDPSWFQVWGMPTADTRCLYTYMFRAGLEHRP